MSTDNAPTKSWFAAPSPIRQLFKSFPLHIYAGEPLPARAPDRLRRRAKLYVFSSHHDALHGLPSYNPTCLKWQTYLRIAGIQVDLVPSNNHASPVGVLPYLLPVSSDSRADIPLTGSKITQYAQKYSSSAAIKHEQQPSSPRREAYLCLLSQNIRPAWLYALYIDPRHTKLVSRLYLPSSSSLPLLSIPLLRSLRSAATNEILKTVRRSLVKPGEIYADAKTAFAALSTLLGEHEWFFNADEPGLLDAEVFAYTFLILDDSFGWETDGLGKCVFAYENLVAHQRRLYRRFWK